MKQFDIRHAKSSMKVGTDALLLGSFVNLNPNSHVLEVGCGCGVISLMLAQRFEDTEIVAIDIDSDSVDETRFNFKNSPFGSRMEVVQSDYQHFDSKNLFDHVVCNPPFFSGSLVAPSRKRHLARHQDQFNLSGFFQKMTSLTKESGELSVIFPASDIELWKWEAGFKNWYPKEILQVRHSPDHPVKRIILTFSKKRHLPQSAEMSIHNLNNYSENYVRMMRNFLLNF